MSSVRAPSIDDVELARRATAGDGEAFGLLFQRWFDRAFDVAWHVVRNRDTAAEVAQEAFATAWQQIATLRQPESFGGWLLRIARNKALNRLERERRSRPLGDEEALVMLDGEHRADDDPATAVGGQERDDLVWAASAALGADDASLLSLHLRHGLDAGELADELGVAANAAHQRLFRLRKRLGDAVASWTLWQRGSPRCPDLRTLLAAAGVTRFDRDASAMITAHVRGCPDCREHQTLALAPEALFAATPFVVAGPALKAKAAAALAARGVPVSAEPPAPEPGPGPGGAGRGPRLVGAGLAAVAAVAVLLMLVGRGGDPDTALAPASVDEPDTTDAADDKDDEDDEPAAQTTAPPAGTPGTPPTAEQRNGEPSTTDPPLVVPPGGPGPTTTTSTTSSTTTSTRPPDPAPVIGGFRVRSATGSCSGTRVRVVFAWQSTNATSALLGPSGGIAQPVDPTGTHTACALPASSWTLQVSGPGGTETAHVTVP